MPSPIPLAIPMPPIPPETEAAAKETIEPIVENAIAKPFDN